MKSNENIGKTWLIASGKGGVGKSLIAASLAAGLSRRGHSVVIVDADIGLRDQDAIFGLQDRVVFDLLDVLNKECTLEQALIAPPEMENLRLLPAAQFARVKELDPKSFNKTVRALRREAEHVIVDCPAGVERGLIGTLGSADECILVTTPDDVCIRDAEKTASLLERKHAPRPYLIVNRLMPELIEAGEMYPAQVVADTLDLRLLGEVPQDVSLYRALLQHRLPMQVDCESNRALQRIVRRMEGQDVPLPAYGTGKKGFLRRLFEPKVKGLKSL